jgi:hypothetical protein
MAELLRCKACGYVTEASRVRNVCPACRAARKAMEAWKDPAGPGRRLILSLDIHPIILHFTMTFACCAFLLAVVSLLAPGLYPQTVLGLLEIFTAILPVVVLAAFAAGLADGRARFRRINAPVLVRKIVFGAVFFIVSGAAAGIILAIGPGVPGVMGAVTALLAVGVVCAAVLGRIGKGLLAAVLPD